MDNQNNQNKNNQGPNNKNNRQGFSFIILVTLITAILVLALYQFQGSAGSQEISYDQFLKYVDDKEVEEVIISSDRITITMKKEKDARTSKQYYTGVVRDDTLAERLDKAGVKFGQEIPDTTSAVILNVLLTLLPIALIVGMFVWMTKRMSKGGGMMGIGKSNAKMYVEKETGITFKDVAGQDEAKESLQEVVDFLHNPGKYTQIGAKLPKGALLVGPPGTGKTLLAKAVAGEAKVPFFSLTGSSFVEMYVGVGASRVRDLFKQAQQMAPCIIFIDEIDAIGKSRDNQLGSNDEREQTLNQLLSEMDGFDMNNGLVLLAATNRPEILDPALLRPGRFDRRIIVEKPDLKGRVDVLKVHSKDVRMDETVDLEAIALATSGAVGSDLANMINEAAINAVKNGRSAVTQGDLFEAVEVVLVGKEKKDRIMSTEERKIVSYHEVGHALVSALQKDAEPVQKITIVPRTMGALGYVMQTPEEEKFLNTKKELEAMLVGMLAGRAAEEIVFDTVTTGAANDIEKATNIARAMITQYGMSEKFGLIGLESIQNRYLDGRAVRNCGEATSAEIDREVMEMLKNAYSEARRLLSEHRQSLDKIAAFLIEKETITGKEFMEIFHEAEGIDPETEKKQGERVTVKEAEPQIEQKSEAAIDSNMESNEAVKEETEE
ncbi:ATP-dependent zinc metalloprotease FtsH [[Clostridium] hylemonae]|uniref:ATP-dependent zinc metalloprotease FtsH n=1 Tax=[Clostridium] hylemonae DSM 15053 TaxID=553973 RepID=C0BYS5_9FIRM|nr:ATP-dependent zinc metalloprotease FtsH [[Clostridium] hylemonae]EEG75003.1 ATP-dependent metallopeptidase HflB [[Clostridium] hylemonae DSM 15053]QEK18350.1 ATP-dependent zinc metalloprotease FtsH [[Clostridium] hylemonae DSM 15053]